MSSSYIVSLMQINNNYGNQLYFPYSIGVLQAYYKCFKHPDSTVYFAPLLYKRSPIAETAEIICNQYKTNMLAISCYVWSWEYSIEVAKLVKKNNPEILIVFGGPHVDEEDVEFFLKYPFIDILVFNEGEETFRELVDCCSLGREYYFVKGIAYNKNHTRIKNEKRIRINNLDAIPSPYLSGVFDDLIKKEKDIEWMALWETNRGCPFTCSYCYWGGAFGDNLYQFDMERIKNEIDWFSNNKIAWIFGCDANFGILKRDMEIAQLLKTAKEKTGYPKQFRVCFTKNSSSQVFDLAKILHDNDMSKGVSLSLQSLNNKTLELVRRKNIKIQNFQELQTKYIENEMVTYTELILALPGETYDSFVDGIDRLLNSHQHTGIVIYNCTILPNTEMGSKQYILDNGLKVVEIPIFQAHSAPRQDEAQEKEKIIVGTKTLSVEDWKRVYRFAWAIQTFHVLGLLQGVAIFYKYHYKVAYRDFYTSLLYFSESNQSNIISLEIERLNILLDNVLNGVGFDQFLDNFPDINWPAEEASFLRISENINLFFYGEVRKFLIFLEKKFQLQKDEHIYNDIIELYATVIKNYEKDSDTILTLNSNVYEYIKSCKTGKPVQLTKGHYIYRVEINKNFEGNKLDFAREVVWYGRKGGKYFYPIIRLQSAPLAKKTKLKQKKGF